MTETEKDYAEYVTRLTRAARRAALQTLTVSTDEKNQALEAVARALETSRAFLQTESRRDLDAAEAAGLAKSMIDRLAFCMKTNCSSLHLPSGIDFHQRHAGCPGRRLDPEKCRQGRRNIDG